MTCILASGSPRRAALLGELGIAAIVRPADIDESPLDAEEPYPHVERLARSKASVGSCGSSEVVIAADTVVTIDGAILGKPHTPDRAKEMLHRLSGRTHEVMTGVAVRTAETTVAGVERTVVRFAPLSDSDIDWYASIAEPLDKAGAYAIQGAGGLFVAAIDGSHDNVIGLPRHRLGQLLGDVGLSYDHLRS